MEITIDSVEPDLSLAVRICEGCHRTIVENEDCSFCGTRPEMLTWRDLRRLRRALATRGANRPDLAERRKQALNAIAAAGDPRLAPDVLPLLHDDWVIVREAAAAALAGLQATEAVEPLVQVLLHDTSPEVRRAAGLALGALRDTRAVAPLLAAERAIPGARGWVADALANLGPGAVPALAKALAQNQKSKHSRLALIQALGRIGEARAVPHLIQAISNASAAERAAIAEALGQIGQPTATDALLGLLADDDLQVAHNAAAALALAAHQACADALVPYLASPQPAVRGCVAAALARAGAKRYAHLVAPLVGDQDVVVRRKAVIALGILGSTANVPVLEQAARDAHAEVRERAAEALGKLNATQSVPQLAALLEDNYQSVRLAAAAALGRIANPAAIAPLARALEYETMTEPKLAMIKALGEIGDSRGLKPLEEALHAESVVRCRAAISIAAIGTESAIPLLTSLLEDPVAEIRHHAVLGLGKLLGGAAIRHIEPLVADADPLVLRAVARVLEKHGDHRARDVVHRAKSLSEQPQSADASSRASRGALRFVPAFILGLVSFRVAVPALVGIVAVVGGILAVTRPSLPEAPLVIPARQSGVAATIPISAGSLACATTTGGLSIWDIDKDEVISSMALDAILEVIAASPDGRMVAAAGDDHVIRLLDVVSGKVLGRLTGHVGVVRAMQFSADGERLVSAGADRQVITWSLKQSIATRRFSLGGTERLTKFCLASDTKRLAVGTETGRVRIVAVDDGTPYATIQACPDQIRALAISSDGRQLAAADAKGAVRVWNVVTRQRTRVLDEDRMQFTTLAFNDAGSLLAGGRPGGVRLWSLESGQPRELVVSFTRGRHPATLEQIASLAFTADGSRLIGAGPANAELLVWNPVTAQRERILTVK